MDETLLVCGFGRCGSSLAMQMIKAAGVPLYKDPGPPLYEIPEAAGLPDTWEWLMDTPGTCVKVLSPQKDTPPPVVPYRAIWLDRDVKEQARSICKMRKYAQARQNRWRLEKRLKADRIKALKVLNDICIEPPFNIKFEHLVQHPLEVAVNLAAYLGIRENLKETAIRMASQVIPRDPKSSKHFGYESANNLGYLILDGKHFKQERTR